MFSTPLTSCSMGVATFSATSRALAPGKFAVMEIVGGATSGYWATGSLTAATTPTMTMTIDRTAAKMGRSMKKRDILNPPEVRGQRSEVTGPKSRRGLDFESLIRAFFRLQRRALSASDVLPGKYSRSL